jgi:hypothetical protein
MGLFTPDDKGKRLIGRNLIISEISTQDKLRLLSGFWETVKPLHFFCQKRQDCITITRQEDGQTIAGVIG